MSLARGQDFGAGWVLQARSLPAGHADGSSLRPGASLAGFFSPVREELCSSSDATTTLTPPHPTPPPAVTHGSDWGFGPVLVGAGVRTGCFGAAAAAETLGAVVSVFKAGRNWRASRRAVREGGAVLEGLVRFRRLV